MPLFGEVLGPNSRKYLPGSANFGPFFPPEEDGQIKKTFLEEKIHLLGYPKIIKSRRSPLQMKNRINFCNFLAFFGKNLSEVKS